MATNPARAIHARLSLDWPGFAFRVDLSLPGQGVTAVFGHSGCGKTTLLRCIAGLERAARGDLTVGGACWQNAKQRLPVWRRPLGVVFQQPSLFPHLSVMGNLQYGLRRANGNRRRLEQAIELFGIAPLLDRRPERLSGGEQSRVAIARALAVDPQLILMDEPMAALDHDRKAEILPYLERLHDELDLPVIYVSHAPDEIARLADHLVVMAEGSVLASGPIAETLARIDLPIRLGEDTGVVVDATIVERDAEWSLARAAFAGGSLWVRDNGWPVGRRIRLRILARDVSLCGTARDDSSILNSLPAQVVESAPDVHPALSLVRLRVGCTAFVARLTRRSAQRLGIVPGLDLWIQIKAVALIG